MAAGSVSGSVLQAGVVHGDVHFHAGGTPQVVPRQLLPADEHFIGRQRELALLDSTIREQSGSSPTVVLLKGQGGVGKTALAVHWLARLTDRFPDGQIFAELVDTAGDPVAPEDLLGQFLRALGVDPQYVPTGLAERAALFRSVTVPRSLALLLDNAFSAAQVRAVLPASGSSLVVVTSRRPLLGLVARGAHVVQVDPLDADSALELLERRVGMARVRAERNHAAVLAKLCGGLPIALCVAAALTVSRRSRSLAWTAEELREEHRRLEVLSVDEDMSVRATFDLSYAELPELAARTYRSLGWCPAARWSVHLIAAATATDLAEAQRATDQLADASLLEELGDGYYQFHDLIRVHARERALIEDPRPTRSAAVRRTVQWYLLVAQSAARAVMPSRRVLTYDLDGTGARPVVPSGVDRYDTALRWLELERRNLIACVRTASEESWYDLAYHLADSMQPLFIVHKHLRDAVEVDEIALHAAQAMGDLDAQNNMSKRLARASARLGAFDEARRHVDSMLEQNRRRGNRRGEASALKSRGIVYVQTGQLQLAVAAFREALALMSEVGQARSQGLLLINLGETLLTLGQVSEAVAHLDTARRLLSTLDTPDHYNAARAAIVLGHAHVQGGRYDTARELLHLALATVTELQSAFEQARAHHALAELARRTGDEVAAGQHEQAAVELSGRPELTGLDPEG
ncbi:MAG TPA: tetratricopeptide repeat protein [Actinophytocola sp.]|uniref:tetratricopeptide repeat protein n=1 Tax=Actinophytocola sp. TaxID=1872138 RepID=UPI002DDCC2D8|nr:tetratricopeptide repeat protein [Actinophytocola sp.]HEV2779463.1 tetratricopeptide repeat protein [Actinophytocola sp.]